jgi:hypothetical protein
MSVVLQVLCGVVLGKKIFSALSKVYWPIILLGFCSPNVCSLLISCSAATTSLCFCLRLQNEAVKQVRAGFNKFLSRNMITS